MLVCGLGENDFGLVILERILVPDLVALSLVTSCAVSLKGMDAKNFIGV